MFFISDIHGEFKKFREWTKTMDYSLQLGDMGLGFPKNERDKYFVEDLNHKFFPGNHDDPAVCRMKPNYLGDYGFCEKQNIFYVSGGYSIDQAYRIIGVSWWEDEELSYETGFKVIDLYQKTKPKIVATHECPTIIKKYALSNFMKNGITSRTEKLLQNLFEIHQPEYWIFGHHHKYIYQKIHNTQFVGLDEAVAGEKQNCIFEIKGIKW